jgi:orotate phosphoribosyltransferase
VTASIIAALTTHAVSRRDEPFTLASGATSHFYVDVKAALCQPEILRDVAAAIADLAHAEDVDFSHVGGLKMGADAVAVAVSLSSGARWGRCRHWRRRIRA